MLPRLNASQRESILPNAQETGLLVYDSTSQRFWFWDAQQWQAIALEDSQVWPPPLIRNANGGTWIHTETDPDSQQIRFVVDSMEVLRARDSVLTLMVPLKWGNGPAISMIEDSSLLGNDSTLATSGAIRHYIDSRPQPGLSGFINVADYGIIPDSTTDYTDTLDALLAAHPGATFIFPDGEYLGRITIRVPQTLISPGGKTVFTTDSVGAAALSLLAACKVEGLHFVHLDSTDGSMGLFNDGQEVALRDCRFEGYENHVAPQFSHSTFDGCRFTCNKESLGSLCWSPNARFTNCTFDGVIGADVMDSKFYYCNFSGLWGVHMPEGAVDNSGNPTGYTGTGEFHHCEILGTYYYAIGLGNKAHARLYNCVVIGFTSGAYARTASTFEAYNSYIACTKAGGASTALKFAKYITDEKAGIGLQDEGDSHFFGCRFENKGTANGFHMIVPDKSDAGRAYFNGCQFDIDKICTEDTASICNGDVYRYMVYEGGPQETPHQTMTVSGGEIIEAQFSAGNVTYLDLTGDGGPASGLRLSKLYGSDREFPLGYQLVIRCGSNTNTISLKQGYYAPLGVGLFTASGQDLQ
ncbi:MAG: hypothetical protein AAFV07_03685 [Bacteroidota bacterium]